MAGFGHKVVAEVVGMKGKCTIGMKEGDSFELSLHRCGDFCGAFYHAIYPWIVNFQLGGSLPGAPDADEMEVVCPNAMNQVRLKLKRVKE